MSAFLNYAPFDTKGVIDDKNRVHLMQCCGWRNTKAAISHELSLPKRRVRTHLLSFSAMETEIYSNILNACLKALQLLGTWYVLAGP